FLEYRAHLGASRFVEVADGFAHHSNHHTGGALHGLEEDVSGKAVGDDDVGLVAADVATFDVAREAKARFAEERVSCALQIAAFPPFLPNRKQSHARVVDPEEHL